MENKKLHITEIYFKRNEVNLRARKLLADFLGLDQKECGVPLHKCSGLLKRFISNYNELVTNAKAKEKDRQGSLF